MSDEVELCRAVMAGFAYLVIISRAAVPQERAHLMAQAPRAIEEPPIQAVACSRCGDDKRTWGPLPPEVKKLFDETPSQPTGVEVPIAPVVQQRCGDLASTWGKAQEPDPNYKPKQVESGPAKAREKHIKRENTKKTQAFSLAAGPLNKLAGTRLKQTSDQPEYLLRNRKVPKVL
ncbi:unnamed protein product [Calicophoron daubneyi]|uniref:Uncharacterized protein n=1 Tax=Calicophoron daubneyi TaxID=300641 RepID=A0AAV2TGC5_CALDB